MTNTNRGNDMDTFDILSVLALLIILLWMSYNVQNATIIQEKDLCVLFVSCFVDYFGAFWGL